MHVMGKGSTRAVPWAKRTIACALAVLLSAPLANAGVVPSKPASEPSQPPATSPDLPDSPGFALQQQTPRENNPQPAPPNQQENAQPQNTPPPVGTAAAPAIQPEGIPASRPSGVAIAPAKQRRVRIWTIRIAIVAAAAVAVGTVTAATLVSPSHPH